MLQHNREFDDLMEKRSVSFTLKGEIYFTLWFLVYKKKKFTAGVKDHMFYIIHHKI